jgi:lipopolysaccharide/colanic/teichoic acid biosynthesis glycosyltransferase
MEESMRLNLRYADDWPLRLDLLILWKTAQAILRREWLIMLPAGGSAH